MVIIGKTGTGKSATGNSILMDNAFNSEMAGSSVTKICKVQQRNVLGNDILVVDTPGLFDTSIPNHETLKEVVRCLYMSAPGPHVVLLTIAVGRLTNEALETIKIFFAYFGEEIKDYFIVVFTNADSLKNKRQGSISIDTFVNEISIKEIQQVLEQCSMRYVAFDNTQDVDSKENEDQVLALLDMARKIIIQNGGSSYTNDMFQRAENERVKREETIRKNIEEEKRAREEQIKRRYAKELRPQLLEEMKKEFEQRNPDFETRKESESGGLWAKILHALADLVQKLGNAFASSIREKAKNY